jgi:hypothetical protein
MFKVPTSAAACADLLYTTRQDRLALQKKVDEMAANEASLKEALINALPKGDATGVAGKIARVTIITKETPQAEDWTLIQAYVKRHNAFDLLQRRLNSKAVLERWADKKTIPGVAMFRAVEVSCVKV